MASTKRRATARRTARKRPGTGGAGKFFRIEVRPGVRFARYRVQTVGRPGHTKRLAGRTADGTWATRSWLVAKTDAHRDGKALVIDDARTKAAIGKAVRGPIRHFKGDIFRAKPRRDIPEREKPTPAMRRAQQKNIKKAQRAWRKMHGR